MQVEIATELPARPRLRLSWARAGRLTLPATILVTLLFELGLAERKYALFGGGFGQPRALDAPLEAGAFLTALLASQALLFYLLWRLMRRLHGRHAGSPLFHINFVFIAGLGAIGVTIAKYEALSYFSDAMSFQVVRNLGGGSLANALLYSMSEVGLVLIVAGGAIGVYGCALWLLCRRWREVPPLPDHWRLTARQTALALLAVPVLLFAANRVEDTRPALVRFNAVAVVTSLLHPATDFDGDGWSAFTYPLDRQPLDGSRHPYALDVPNDGIDQDGYGGDLAFSGEAEATGAPAIAGEKRHVILIVLESTRADALGRRIRGRPVMPNLEALATRGSSAREAYSHVGFTSQSLQSLFTGQLAPAAARQSIVSDFLANGYRVGVFSGQGEDWGGTADLTGLRRASVYVDANTLKDERGFGYSALASLYVDGRILLREFDRRLGRPEAWSQPQFLYFNFQSAHFPYWAPGMDAILGGEPIPRSSITAENREWVERTYWNAVAYNDRLIGELLARLRRLGVLEDSLVVVTSDHGESLFDDGFLGHGHALNPQQTRIPFVLSDAGVALRSPIGLADMRAIILRAAGATLPDVQRASVFQYLGTLERPGTIGVVGRGGAWTRFDLFREEAWTPRTGGWVRYADLRREDRAATDALIDEWARQRWFQRLRNDE